jgi:hypothetical protein
MRRLAWIALTGLLLQPAVAVLCEARCLTTAAPRQAAAAPSCHEASGSADDSQTVVSAGLDACAHADRVEPASTTLLRDHLTVVALPHTRPAPVASAPTIPTKPTRASIRHRAPDDSSGTLRV